MPNANLGRVRTQIQVIQLYLANSIGNMMCLCYMQGYLVVVVHV